MHQVSEPDGDTVEQHQAIAGEHRGGIKCRLNSDPAIACPLLAVLRDALAHLVVEGFRRGDVGAEAAVLAGKVFGKTAFTRASAAEDEGEPAHAGARGMRATK